MERKKRFGEDFFIVLEYEKRIIGTVMGRYDGHRGVMNYLVIAPECQGNGFGKILVEATKKT